LAFGNKFSYGVPDDLGIPCPADSISNNLSGYNGIADYFSDTAFVNAANFFSSSSNDVTDGAATGVFSLIAAVDAMQQIEKVVQQKEEAEVLQATLWPVRGYSATSRP
jgi:hypothetical protein